MIDTMRQEFSASFHPASAAVGRRARRARIRIGTRLVAPALVIGVMAASVAAAQGVEGPKPGTAGPAAPAPSGDRPPPLTRPAAPAQVPVGEAPAFFVDVNGQPQGPFTLQQLAEWAAAGRLSAETLVWRRGTPDWQPAQLMPELRPMLSAGPPAVPHRMRFERFMLGTWEEQSRHGTISVSTTLRFASDGSFSGVQRSQLAGTSAPALATPVTGTWSVEAMGDRRFVLTLTPREEGFRRQVTTQILVDDQQIRNEETGAISRRVGQ